MIPAQLLATIHHHDQNPPDNEIEHRNEMMLVKRYVVCRMKKEMVKV